MQIPKIRVGDRVVFSKEPFTSDWSHTQDMNMVRGGSYLVRTGVNKDGVFQIGFKGANPLFDAWYHVKWVSQVIRGDTDEVIDMPDWFALAEQEEKERQEQLRRQKELKTKRNQEFVDFITRHVSYEEAEEFYRRYASAPMETVLNNFEITESMELIHGTFDPVIHSSLTGNTKWEILDDLWMKYLTTKHLEFIDNNWN